MYCSMDGTHVGGKRRKAGLANVSCFSGVVRVNVQPRINVETARVDIVKDRNLKGIAKWF